jgi:hypothetical protein
MVGSNYSAAHRKKISINFKAPENENPSEEVEKI